VTDSELLLVFDATVDPDGLRGWLRHLKAGGITASLHSFGSAAVIAAKTPAIDLPAPGQLAPPREIVRSSGAIRLSQRDLHPRGTVVPVGPTNIGDGGITVFAGPCAVESREQVNATARSVAQAGAAGLRGGAFKPRTSPYSFQGRGWEGLELLAEARASTGLPVLTEVVAPAHVERLAMVADALQIGTRNMQNFELLTEVARSGRPVVLKRGFGATIDELLGAAEYILAEGNGMVILCERGIRTFEPSQRFTIDLGSVAVLKKRTHLPVMVDPSHALGIPDLVEPIALAAVAVGADALLIDVHVAPEQALCDGQQALRPAEFERLMNRLDPLAAALGRRVTTPDRHETVKAASGGDFW
jgi:3-deoxy-7-phosphoheptulonate synthase